MDLWHFLGHGIITLPAAWGAAMKPRFSIRKMLWLAVGAAILVAIAVFIREWADYVQYMSEQIRATEASHPR
jgi:hypothetical protein